MFKFSYKLNKNAVTNVFFADEDLNFLKNSNYILKNNLKNISCFKEEFKKLDYIFFNTFEGKKKIIYIFLKLDLF